MAGAGGESTTSSADGGGIRPLVLAEGPPAGRRRVLDDAIASARRDGWGIVRGWAAPLGRERIVCTGIVRTRDQGRRALLAALAGSGLIVALSADRETIDRFLDDLRRLGPVAHLVVPNERRVLSDAERTLLEALADGLTVREAAAELGVAVRTAERRLATARRILGVPSTAAAIVSGLARGR